MLTKSRSEYRPNNANFCCKKNRDLRCCVARRLKRQKKTPEITRKRALHLNKLPTNFTMLIHNVSPKTRLKELERAVFTRAVRLICSFQYDCMIPRETIISRGKGSRTDCRKKARRPSPPKTMAHRPEYYSIDLETRPAKRARSLLRLLIRWLHS